MAEISPIQKNQSRRGGKRPGAGRKRGVPVKATPRERNDIADQAKDYADVALQALVGIVRQGMSEAARVTAATALLDRGYGKPRQSVEHAGKDGGPIQVQVWHFGDKKVSF